MEKLDKNAKGGNEDGGERGNAPRVENQGGDTSFKQLIMFDKSSSKRNPVVFSRMAKEEYDPKSKIDTDCLDSCIVNIRKLLLELENEKGVELRAHSTKQRAINKYSQKRFKSPPEQYYRLENPEDKTLIFESRFESGNLNLAYKVSDTEYNLIL